MGLMSNDMPVTGKEPGPDTKKFYFMSEGDGFGPHVFRNVDDPKDVINVCSCGGTSDPGGRCDQNCQQKIPIGCCCWYCKPRVHRAFKPVDQKHCTNCE
jgi:hypothetical protein